MFAWKRIEDGEIAQQTFATSKALLFETAGFGSVRVDEPIKGYIAVPVELHDGVLVELPEEKPK